MTDADKKKLEQKVMSLRDHYKEYSKNNLIDVFNDIAEFLEPKDMTAERFAETAGSSGSHTTKFPNSRSQTGSLTFSEGQSNGPGKLFFSGKSHISKTAKVLHRPIKIAGQEETTGFLQRMISGDPMIGKLEEAFVAVFGSECLDAVKEGVRGRYKKTEDVHLHYENFPVTYIPGPDETDLLTSPMPSLETLNDMWRIKESAYEQSKESDEVTSGSWIRTFLSDKVQNVALNLGKSELRFFAQLPRTLTAMESQLWALKFNPSRFPRFYDDEVSALVLKYAERLERAQKEGAYSSADMNRATDRIAAQIIRSARTFIEDVLTSFHEAFPESEVEHPSILSTLNSLSFPEADRVFAQASFKSSHFKKQLQLQGDRT